MKPRIVVVGSANTDFMVHVDQLPGRGETVLGHRFQVAGGGKGANQAVAAARLGGQVTLIARLGDDDLGHAALRAYRQEGIHTDFIHYDREAASGVALILVEQGGDNVIAVAPGANGRLAPNDILAAEDVIRQADCLLVQLEIPYESVRTAAELAHRSQVHVILNPAPARQLPLELFQYIDVLTPNESEALILAGAAGPTDSRKSFSSLAGRLHVPHLIVTLGASGALLIAEGVETIVPAFKVTPIDTTAAGDAFNGALAVALARGEKLAEAVRYANAAGALTTTRVGAQPSLPTAGELEQFISTSALAAGAGRAENQAEAKQDE